MCGNKRGPLFTVIDAPLIIIEIASGNNYKAHNNMISI